MKFALPTIVTLAALSGVARADEVDPVFTPTIINANVSQVFVPNGFDDNDNVEVIVHGHFKNSCYRVGSIYGTVDNETREVHIHAKAFLYQGDTCIEMAVPFTQSVKLGMLPAGNYTVKGGANDVNLTVSHSTSTSPDDYLYAPVEQVEIERTTESFSVVNLKVKGTFPLLAEGCMRLKEVRAFTSPDNVLVVLPISEIVTGEDCSNHTSAFQRSFEHAQPLNINLADEVLVHVRVLNGQSLNRVVEIR